MYGGIVVGMHPTGMLACSCVDFIIKNPEIDMRLEN